MPHVIDADVQAKHTFTRRKKARSCSGELFSSFGASTYSRAISQITCEVAAEYQSYQRMASTNHNENKQS